MPSKREIFALHLFFLEIVTLKEEFIHLLRLTFWLHHLLLLLLPLQELLILISILSLLLLIAKDVKYFCVNYGLQEKKLRRYKKRLLLHKSSYKHTANLVKEQIDGIASMLKRQHISNGKKPLLIFMILLSSSQLRSSFLH